MLQGAMMDRAFTRKHAPSGLPVERRLESLGIPENQDD
eukprot:CAMPEP_0117531410 /NCGR_PEP_ID=MMETSP0784-20121206/38844_1 /TAXON_ID=39447 /ORGANISM="" /LENGTH=37 /DNA_ID= /DNA_START= /DNA_END= /DNA_ORIENTATION=